MQIRDHVRRAKREPSSEHIEQMWRAIFTLKAWYFLPARRSEGPNRPLVLELGGEVWLPVFTDVRRYRQFAERAGRVDEDGAMHGMMLDPGESLQAVDEVRESIEGLVFNPGTTIALRAPTEAVVAYARYFDIPKFSG